MKDKLTRLQEYLLNNGYEQDAKRIGGILEEYLKEDQLSELSARKLIAMCNPKYFGNFYIREFNNTYEWWNFLSEVVSDIR